MKKTILTLIAVSAAAISISAFAQSSPFAKPEDAVKYRKAALTVTAAHFGRLGAMAQGKAPFDAKTAAENAEFGSKTPSSKRPQTSSKLKPQSWPLQLRAAEKMLSKQLSRQPLALASHVTMTSEPNKHRR
jgi:cytochrome c556